MTKYVKIAGNPKIGLVVLGDDGSVSNLNVVEPSSGWNISTKALTIPSDTFSHLSTTGTATGFTTTVASAKRVDYLNTLGNVAATWKAAKPALPAAIEIIGVTGDSAGGYMLLGKDQKFYKVSPDGKEWKPSASPLPLTGEVKLIAGDLKGVVAVSGSELVRGTSDACGWTAVKPDAPIDISLITGDATKGFVVYGEGQLYSLDVSKPVAAWTPITAPKMQFLSLSGNLADGLAAVIGDSTGAGTAVVYSVAPLKGTWSLALAPVKSEPAATNATAAPADKDAKAAPAAA